MAVLLRTGTLLLVAGDQELDRCKELCTFSIERVLLLVWAATGTMDDHNCPFLGALESLISRSTISFPEPFRTGPCRRGPDNRESRGGHDGGERQHRDPALQTGHIEDPMMQDSVIRKTGGQG